MTHEARQLQLMRDVLRFVPAEHQREAGDKLLMLIADVRVETASLTNAVSPIRMDISSPSRLLGWWTPITNAKRTSE